MLARIRPQLSLHSCLQSCFQLLFAPCDVSGSVDDLQGQEQGTAGQACNA